MLNTDSGKQYYVGLNKDREETEFNYFICLMRELSAVSGIQRKFRFLLNRL